MRNSEYQKFLVYCVVLKSIIVLKIIFFAIFFISINLLAFGQSDCGKYFTKGGDEFEEQIIYSSDDIIIHREDGKELITSILFGKNIDLSNKKSLNDSVKTQDNKEYLWIFIPNFDSSPTDLTGVQISILFTDSSVEKYRIYYSPDKKRYTLTLNTGIIDSSADGSANEVDQLISSLTTKQIKGIRLYMEAGNEDFFLSEEAARQIQYLFRCAEKLVSTL